MLFKILIVLILVGYLFHKIASFVFRGLFKGFAGRDQFGQQQHSQRRAKNSNVNIDNIPHSKAKKGDNFSGGEYVDYEEVK